MQFIECENEKRTFWTKHEGIHTHRVWNRITFFLLFENKLRQMQWHYVGSNASILICRKVRFDTVNTKDVQWKSIDDDWAKCVSVLWKWNNFHNFYFFYGIQFPFRLNSVERNEYMNIETWHSKSKLNHPLNCHSGHLSSSSSSVIAECWHWTTCSM